MPNETSDSLQQQQITFQIPPLIYHSFSLLLTKEIGGDLIYFSNGF